jgi:hypothetical protein
MVRANAMSVVTTAGANGAREPLRSPEALVLTGSRFHTGTGGVDMLLDAAAVRTAPVQVGDTLVPTGAHGGAGTPWATPWTSSGSGSDSDNDSGVNSRGVTPMQTTPEAYQSWHSDDEGDDPGPYSPWSGGPTTEDDLGAHECMPVSPLLSPQTPSNWAATPCVSPGGWGDGSLVSPRAMFGSTYGGGGSGGKDVTTPVYVPVSPAYAPASPAYAPASPVFGTPGQTHGPYVPFTPVVGASNGTDPAPKTPWFNPAHANPSPSPSPSTNGESGLHTDSGAHPRATTGVGYTPAGWG